MFQNFNNTLIWAICIAEWFSNIKPNGSRCQFSNGFFKDSAMISVDLEVATQSPNLESLYSFIAYKI